MPEIQCSLEFRVRYSETDQMGGIYNSRVLEWFELGRSEWFRTAGIPYTEIETRGVFLPLVEAHVEYKGRARYDDLLRLTATARMSGKARLRCDCFLVHAQSGDPVAQGYTVHACMDTNGRAIRPPEWLITLFGN